MESVLIVTYSNKNALGIAELISPFSLECVFARSAGQARRQMLEREFDYVIINAPLSDQTGEELACQVAQKGYCQVLLIVPSENYEAVTSACEHEGVFTISKPFNSQMFLQSFSIVRGAHVKIKRVQAEDSDYVELIEGIRTLDRAKRILVFSFGMSENQAHRYIEKKAMDTRNTKQTIARLIIEGYEE